MSDLGEKEEEVVTGEDEGEEEEEENDEVEVVHDPDAEDFFTYEGKHTISYKITEIMAYHPIKVSCCVFWIILIIVVISTALGVGSVSEASEYDWVIADTEESENLDALDNAKSQVDTQATVVEERVQILDDKFYYIFETTDNLDIYTPSNLHHMCVVESTMIETEGWSDVCHIINGTCSLPDTSISVYFYNFQSVDDWNCTVLNDTYVNEMKKPIYDAMVTPAGQEEYGTWLSHDAVELGYSTKCNSIWDFGTPLPGYESDSDRWEDQFKVYQEFLSSLDGSVGGVEEKLFDIYDIDDNADGFFKYYPSPYMSKAEKFSLRQHWFSIFNLQNEFIRLLASDLFFAIFSIIFVVIWLRVHTGSWLISLSGMFMIVMSLPITVFIYKRLFHIPYYSEIHSLVLFIVLGIGADDIFVLNDSWKLTRLLYHKDITNGRHRVTVHRRLLKCYRHTMSTVFNTSFTTSMAFIATGLSPLMPIATFGWFAATCIMCNYIFVITLMPPVVVLSEMYFENSIIPCQERKEEPSFVNHSSTKSEDAEYENVDNNKIKDHDFALSKDVELTSYAGKGNGESVLGENVDCNNVLDEPNTELAHNNDKKPDYSETIKPSSIGEKLVDGYIKFMECHVTFFDRKFYINAIIIFVSLFIFGIVGIVYGLQLETPTSQEAWFKDGHMLQSAQFMMSSDFMGFDDSSYEMISINMGISGIDRSGFNEYIPPKNRGRALFDDSFELAQPNCQKALIRMCEDIPKFECSASACKPTGLIARQNSTVCFMQDFRVWANVNLGIDTYTMNETYFYDKLNQFRYETGEYVEDIGFIDGDVKYVSISFTSTMETEEHMKGKRDVHKCLKNLLRQISSYDECNSCSCGSVMFTSPYAFVWMHSEIGLVQGFYQGMFVAFPVALFVLLFATGNAIISFFAIVAVLFIVFGVLGFSNYALNWDMGAAESIAGIIIIGFSVDYTVHLGHMYTDAEKQFGYTDRKSKFEHASKEMALTVVGGAITTAGAGCVLYACQLQFFVKMAMLIVCTIVLSFLYSLGFFMSILLVLGPENDQGKILVWMNWMREKLNIPKAKKVSTEKVSQKDDTEA